MNPYPPVRTASQKRLLRVADVLYSSGAPLRAPDLPEQPIKVVCVSDTHNQTPALPDGDLLVHAGDLTERGTFAEMQTQLDWLNQQPHLRKVVIAGNHDRILDASYEHAARDTPHQASEVPSANDLKWAP